MPPGPPPTTAMDMGLEKDGLVRAVYPAAVLLQACLEPGLSDAGRPKSNVAVARRPASTICMEPRRECVFPGDLLVQSRSEGRGLCAARGEVIGGGGCPAGGCGVGDLCLCRGEDGGKDGGEGMLGLGLPMGTVSCSQSSSSSLGWAGPRCCWWYRPERR